MHIATENCNFWDLVVFLGFCGLLLGFVGVCCFFFWICRFLWDFDRRVLMLKCLGLLLVWPIFGILVGFV